MNICIIYQHGITYSFPTICGYLKHEQCISILQCIGKDNQSVNTLEYKGCELSTQNSQKGACKHYYQGTQHTGHKTCNHIAQSNLHMRPERVTSNTQTNPIVSQLSILKSKLSFVLNYSPIALIFRQNQLNPSPKLTALCQTPLFSVIRMSKSVICLNKTRMTLKAF